LEQEGGIAGRGTEKVSVERKIDSLKRKK